MLTATKYPRHLAALFDRLVAQEPLDHAAATKGALKACLDCVSTLCQVVAPPPGGKGPAADASPRLSPRSLCSRSHESTLASGLRQPSRS